MASSGLPMPIKTAADEMTSSAHAGINFEGMRSDFSNGQRGQANHM